MPALDVTRVLQVAQTSEQPSELHAHLQELSGLGPAPFAAAALIGPVPCMGAMSAGSRLAV